VQEGADPGDSSPVNARSYAKSALRSLDGREDAQTMAEYAVVLGDVTP
jgi:hypothetical protein